MRITNHFEKRLKERFLWDIKTLRENSKGLRMETFKCSKKLNEKYKGLGELMRDNKTTFRIIEDMNLVMVQVGISFVTCYRLWGN